MDSENKKFPPPRRRVVDPYRQPAPTPQPSADVTSAPIVRAPDSRDVFEDLEKVEVDPRALAEARSSNRAWGGAAIALGLFLVIFCLALGISAPSNYGYRSSRIISLPGIGVFLIFYGIAKWRQRGIDY